MYSKNDSQLIKNVSHNFSETINKSNYGDVICLLDDTNDIQGSQSKHKNNIESSIDTCIKPHEEKITKGITYLYN